ncbi:hypothetical protein D6D54_05235 [Spiroplasma poulsonii]|uniref:Uncharacterized protein n=1 Tax=Spiroplasma poulsonii TaxID=2138 RepID=A0A433EQT2_9MOLU|nr:hypothetical protein [Spiroplasma poulsonii]MBW3058946.1 hypothetical protein [Spiroplasma poulsonii]RUP76836.1 hypothetical protein D6D54_05235 [Spiroplasma poulsonii]
MKNVIPKKLKDAKYRFWRNITITDVLIIAVWVGLTIMFIFGFQWKLWIKLLSSSIMILISLPLIITNKKTNLKGWQHLYYVYCNCKHAFPKALINKMITSFKINATIF